MKTARRISLPFVVLLVLLMSGCTNPSKVAVEFVSQHPELRDSVKGHVLSNRVPDIVLETWGRTKIKTGDLEHQIIDYALEKTWDEFNSVGAIQHPDRPTAYNYAGITANIRPIIGYSENMSTVGLHTSYNAPSWLFLEQIVVLVGSKRYATPKISIFDTNVVRDVNYNGSITERYTFYFRTSKATEELVYAVVNAPESVEVKVRLSGSSGYLDFVLPVDVRRSWQDVIWYYDREYKSK